MHGIRGTGDAMKTKRNKGAGYQNKPVCGGKGGGRDGREGRDGTAWAQLPSPPSTLAQTAISQKYLHWREQKFATDKETRFLSQRHARLQQKKTPRLQRVQT